ncbi:ABC transporter permease subunit [Micromonospora tarensis]|uniref:ABC transporter permease subunit n=1 Tax=Micromonospora tarensis TaxID=2806100 RepID=UPI001EE4D77B|nr:ABC transporter permease subunit [Micromonospora tarensis]
MLPALVRKTWRDDRLALIGWAGGVAAFTGIYASFYSQFQGAAELKQDALPQGMLDFLGIADMLSPAGYLQATIFSLVGPLLVLMCAITLAARTIARPEEDGGMELMLANPVTRASFAWQRVAAAGSALTGIAAIPGILLMIIVPWIGMDIPLSNVAAASAGLVALVWSFAASPSSLAPPPENGLPSSRSPVALPWPRTWPTPSAACSTGGTGCAGCHRSTTSSAPTRCTPAGTRPSFSPSCSSVRQPRPPESSCSTAATSVCRREAGGLRFPAATSTPTRNSR